MVGGYGCPFIHTEETDLDKANLGYKHMQLIWSLKISWGHFKCKLCLMFIILIKNVAFRWKKIEVVVNNYSEKAYFTFTLSFEAINLQINYETMKVIVEQKYCSYKM